MLKYVAKRALVGLVAVLVSLTVNFVLVRVAPGDPVKILAGNDNPNPEMIAMLTEKYGLNQPIYVQFGAYLMNLVKGDLGFSYLSGEPVLTLILGKVGPTFLLAMTGSILALIIGTLMGVVAARKNNSAFDRFMCSFSYLFDATPGFWLGLMMILIFASWLKVLPTAGMIDLRAGYKGFAYVVDVAIHLILPAGTLMLIQIPGYFRIARASVLQVMSEDFITTFRATGMKDNKIFMNYVLKNAILPTITIFSMTLAYMISGVVLIETVFAWPGMGRVIMNAIMRRDYPVLTGVYLIISVSVAAMMVLIDLVYAAVDPRIRLK